MFFGGDISLPRLELWIAENLDLAAKKMWCFDERLHELLILSYAFNFAKHESVFGDAIGIFSQ